jgi:hypothetical protein
VNFVLRTWLKKQENSLNSTRNGIITFALAPQFLGFIFLWVVRIIKLLNESEDKKCTYEKIVEVGEEHHCDTVGAQLKILKKLKVINFDQVRYLL